MLSKKVGIFFNLNNITYWIEDIELFKYYLTNEGKLVVPDLALTGYMSTNYYYYLSFGIQNSMY